ncbi:MATE efflux family protein [Clostridium baratii str. Sullivan]|uniref:Multidrug export protein MepA n=1 Tax=Clostridium baratii str. Sullivan TaxID=1415775 RepID=A0A0A7FUQ0_9CLOT|nr:MATE family efflux transporter [Clostridium baratii]AIY83349.1 MATE efflux family protein [Clostridium baratii str. Sullivan]
MKNIESLAEEKISKLLIKYSVPAILSMLITSLYNIVDRAFIGAIKDVGALAIAGLGVTMPIFTLIVSFGVLISMGATTNIAIKLGEGNRKEAEKYLGNAFIFSIIVALAIMVIGLSFINPILKIFGASSDTIIYAKEYISVILIGSVSCITGFTLNNIIRVDGSPKFAARTMILGCLINVILDPIFIFTFNMGIKGAAIATVLTQVIVFMVIIWYFLSNKSTMKLKRENFRLEIKTVKKIILLGIAPFLMELATSFVSLIMNNALKIYGGDLAIGAMTAVTSIVLIFIMPIFGINQGVQTIIGYNYGAKKYKRAKDSLKLAILYSTIISVIGFILIEISPRVFISIFSTDSELMNIAISGLRVYASTLPLIGVILIGPAYFQAIGKVKQSMFLSVLRQVIVLIPVLYVLPKFINLNGVWVAQPITDIISAVIIVFLLVKEFRSINVR